MQHRRKTCTRKSSDDPSDDPSDVRRHYAALCDVFSQTLIQQKLATVRRARVANTVYSIPMSYRSFRSTFIPQIVGGPKLDLTVKAVLTTSEFTIVTFHRTVLGWQADELAIPSHGKTTGLPFKATASHKSCNTRRQQACRSKLWQADELDVPSPGKPTNSSSRATACRQTCRPKP